jgi:photosystem II stability/assembly factor-like uncharacterized protein
MRRSERRSATRRKTRSGFRRVFLETLEPRLTLATYYPIPIADAATGNTLRHAVIQSNASQEADTIVLQGATYHLTIAGSGEDGAATGDLDVLGTLTIRGAGQNVTTIDASAMGDRIFDLLSGGNLIIEDATIRGGHAQQGGAIRVNQGNLTMIRCRLLENTAEGLAGGDGLGGAVYVDAGTTTLNCCEFRDNDAIGADAVGGADLGGFGQGGAVYLEDSHAIICSTQFENNRATGGLASTAPASSGGCGSGGAIYGLGSVVTVWQSSFEGNAAAGGNGQDADVATAGGAAQGGAIHVQSGSSLQVREAVFADNTTRGGHGANGPDGGDGGDGDGGAVSVAFGSNVVVDASDFWRNEALGGNAGAGGTQPPPFTAHAGGSGLGGAVYSYIGASLSITDSTFGDNRAAGGRGGDGAEGGYGGDGGDGQGGAVWSASEAAVAIRLTVSQSLFQNNEALGGTPGQGDSANGHGGVASAGGVSIGSAVEASLVEVRILGNRAVGAGPAQGGGADSLAAKVTIVDSVFADNQALGGTASFGAGGGFQGNDTELHVSGTKFRRNLALGGEGIGIYPGGWGQGGAVCLVAGSTGSLSYSLFQSNQATGGLGGESSSGGGAVGGGLFYDGLAEGLDLTSCTFGHNDADGGAASPGNDMGEAAGGGVWADPAESLQMTGCVVHENHAYGATGRGGGVFLEDKGSGSAILRWSDVTENLASTEGNDIFGPYVIYYAGWTVGSASDGYGTILRSTDSGNIWTRQGEGQIADVDLSGVVAVGPLSAWVVGGSDHDSVLNPNGYGTVYHTTDGGTTWERKGAVGEIGNVDLVKVTAYGDSVWAVGTNGILHTSDGGATWTNQLPTGYENVILQGVYTPDGNTVWVTGGNKDGYATVLKSTDAGLTWTRQSNGPVQSADHLLGISATDVNTAWAVGGAPGGMGSSHIILNTTDGGDTWIDQTDNGAAGGGDVNEVCALSTSTVWVASDTTIYWSANGGAHWDSHPSDFFTLGVSAVSSQEAWAVTGGGGGKIYHTGDGGSDWTELDGFPDLETVSFSPGAGETPMANTIGLFDPVASVFYLKNENQSGIADSMFAYGPPGSGWQPIAGDWDGYGDDTIGLYHPAVSVFYLRDTNDSGDADRTFGYGPPWLCWLSITGDWNGDGDDTVGLYDPVASVFYLRDTNDSGDADLAFSYGLPGGGWLPIAGDWDGDGNDTIGLYDPAGSVFYLRNTNDGGYADLTFDYGLPGGGWLPIAGDWDGDGDDTIGLYDPVASAFYLRDTNDNGDADLAFDYGVPGGAWLPIVGDWSGAGSPLLAAGGVVSAAEDAIPLTQTDLDPIVAQAIADWADFGLATDQLEALVTVRFVSIDFSGAQLGLAERDTIFLDINAAGHGWFVDPTPGADEEFHAIGNHLEALDPVVLDRIDLLTVVSHEIGHALGLDDLDSSFDSLMSDTLETGVRQEPGTAEVDALFAGL